MRLRTRRQYLRMNHATSRHVGSFVIIDSMKNRGHSARLGITVTKRYGDAFKRNRFKRLVREAFRLCRHQLPSNLDLHVKPRSKAEEVTLALMMQEMLQLLNHPCPDST